MTHDEPRCPKSNHVEERKAEIDETIATLTKGYKEEQKNFGEQLVNQTKVKRGVIAEAKAQVLIFKEKEKFDKAVMKRAKEISKSTSMQIDKVRSDFEDALSKSAERQVKTSQNISYENMHSTLTLFGGIVRNYVPISEKTKEKIYKGPLNPSCMIVLEMLNKSGALSRQTKEGVLKREDCGRLRGEEIEMRPGWRYGKEVNLRN